MYEFCSAALPWVALAVFLAVFAAFSSHKISPRPAWACMGFFGGIAFASLLGISLTIGMPLGLTAGLLLSGRQTDNETKAEE